MHNTSGVTKETMNSRVTATSIRDDQANNRSDLPEQWNHSTYMGTRKMIHKT